jgi:hypothetical protein
MGLALRIWDNILASGTQFMFHVALSILTIYKDKLIGLDTPSILEIFNLFREDDEMALPPIELIIQTAWKMDLDDEKITELLDNFDLTLTQPNNFNQD